MKISNDFSLKPFNTFRVDVLSKYFTVCESDEDLLETFDFIRKKKLEHLVIGEGSNILFTKNFDGLVFEYANESLREIKSDETKIRLEVGAGKNWDQFVDYCTKNNFGGVENLSLIPGKVGAAPVQNIGAYGQELADVLVCVNGFFIHTSEKFSFSKDECKLGYRNSIFKTALKNKVVITSIQVELSKQPTLNLSYGNLTEEISKQNLSDVTIQNVRNVVIQIRKSKLPDPDIIGNAGSFFKNPEIDEVHFNSLIEKFGDLKYFRLATNKYKVPAAWLIEKCELKGMRIGNAGTHDKQPLVIINYGNASPDEILSVKNKIQKDVFEKFQIHLEAEVNIV